ncbi:MAG: hypothetical protein DMG65_20015 [Candidatus Angelobacter sp. Gp1-AA117]|nr:MAG: hypothetical protein DMG65_20015 [Candidatus Angelobacter sp. Gp1-AA117]
MAANTPHLVFDEIQRRSSIPLLSIVRAASDHAKTLGLKNSACLAPDLRCVPISIRRSSSERALIWSGQKNQNSNSFTASTSMSC